MTGTRKTIEIALFIAVNLWLAMGGYQVIACGLARLILSNCRSRF